MRAFIERVFKSKKLKKEQKIKETLKEAEQFVQEKKEKHVDCECKECIARIKQNAE